MIYAYRDKGLWGQKLREAGAKKGIEVSLFDESDEVPDIGNHVVFVHLNHHPEYREQNKRMMVRLAKKKNKLIPTLFESYLYDNKIAQYEYLHDHMPQSYIIKSIEESKNLLSTLQYPFISKTSSGAGSKNVRLIQNKQAALKEIKMAFGEGIPVHHNQKQRGYLYWQKFCSGNHWDWRVHIIAKKYACILKRYNCKNLPFASGSHHSKAINVLDDSTTKLLNRAYRIASDHNFTLCAMDFIQDGNDYKLLEISAAWGPINTFTGRKLFQLSGESWEYSGYISDVFFDFMIDIIQKNEFK